MSEENEMNKMGVEPVRKLLMTMGLPMIISMALQALYNIVDSYFVSCMKDTAEVSNMGDYGVNALTLAFPVQMLMVAIGVGTGVGINAIMSRSLGEGDRERGSRIAGNSVFLSLCTFVVFFLFGIFGVKAYIHSQTTNPVILEMGTDYLRICSVWSIGITLYIAYEKLLQATGRTMLCTIAQITGAVENIILDPIFIFGYFGLPQMGIRGAAYATVVGQCVTALTDAVFHYKFNKSDIDTDFKYIKPNGKIILDIYKVGIPAILMQALMSFMTYGVNLIFGTVSEAAVTAYGVYYKIQQFVFFAAFGMNNAMIPVIAFNYGMGSRQRVNDGIRYGMWYTLIIMLTGALGLQAFAGQITGVFAVSQETTLLCIRAIRVITLGYLFVGANIAYQGIFQALGHGVYSLIVSLLRLLVVALPVAWALAKWNPDVMWAAFPFAEFVACIVAVLMMRYIRRTQISTLLDTVVQTAVAEPRRV